MTGDFRTSEPWRIGRRKSSAFYEGSIDEVRIYRRVLTDSESTLWAVDNEQLKRALAVVGKEETRRTQTDKQALFQYFADRDKNISKRKQELRHLSARPEDSLVLRKIRSGEMPPKENLLNTGTRPLKARDIARLEQWIKAGAPEVELPAETAGTAADPLVDDDDRGYWAFQAPVHIPVPRSPDSSIANPIDAFVANRLQEAGLTFSPTAGPSTLARRAYFDLHGLPPTPSQLQQFLDDDRPGAFARLVDRLLASPRYGERWGRHWLDAVGYADWFGGKL